MGQEIPTTAGCWYGQLSTENSQGTTQVIRHPEHQEITRTDAGHKFSFGTNSGFNNSKMNSASPYLVSTYLCSCIRSQPKKCPALGGDPTSTFKCYTFISLVMVIDILGLEHTLTKRFIKIKRIRGALSDHITNISSVNSAQSHLAFSTTYHMSFRNTSINSTLTRNFLKLTPQEGRVKAYLNPRWCEQSLNLTSDFKRSIANSKF